MKKFFLLSLLFIVSQNLHAKEPLESLKYKRDLIRYSRITWGMDAPIALFASQIHQESSWNHLAKSKYAKGLSQFTPRTAKWIRDVFPELKIGNIYNPIWSIRAMLLYDQWLDKEISSTGQCDQWAMILSSYNGGLTWLNRDKSLTEANGSNPKIWWDSVELYSSRDNWAMIENRNYSKKIIFEHQLIYKNWGNKYICINK